ncbi:MAG: response regulator transcription factor [Sandaracinaceae bacterium]|nr:response regulator transcription factor [Sandaracinaceae bacterium]
MSSEASVIRLVVADDFPAVRRGVISVIASIPGVEIVAEAGSAEEVARAIEETQPDLAVLDLGMPGVAGMELLRELRRRYPSLGLLVFSMQREDEVAVACLRAGASGFLNKAAPVEELVRAVRTVTEGRRYLSPWLVETLVDGAPLPGQDPPHVALSERERDVMMRLANGERVGDIARELGISAKTVHTYRARILSKLDAQTNVDLVLYAVKHRLFGWPPHDVPRARSRATS